MRHDVDAVVCGVGSGGTLTGLGRFFRASNHARGIEMILADPTGSVLMSYVKTGKLVESGSWAVEGIGEDFIPEIADLSFVTDAFEIDDEEVSRRRANFCVRKEFSAAPPPARSWPVRCIIAENNQAEAGCDFRGRYRQQISLQDV